MIGRSISHYVIEDKLGEGGMGTVFLARDSKLGRRVAIKVLSPPLAQEGRGRLLREARSASRLNHPNIVTIHEIGHAEGIDFIVMECVEGRTLAREIPEGGLPIARVMGLAVQIADALAAAHRAHVVHRDLKPGNVIVTPGGQIKVLDFGLAKTLTPPEMSSVAPTREMETAALSTPGQVMGTVGYMSPEQIQGRLTDARSDIFAMGVLLFEMLTGERPFVGDSHWAVMAATVEGHARPLRDLRPEIPPDLARIVTRCLAVRPEERYASGAELADELSRFVPSPPPSKSRSRLSRPIILGTIALGVLFLLFLTWSARREARMRWATENAPVEIDSLRASGDIVGAYRMGERALAIAPRDARVKQAWADLTITPPISSDPPGAEVAFRNYTGPLSDWVSLGPTPLSATVPIAFLRWRLTKVGYDTLEVGQGPNALEFRLVSGDSSRPGMVLVPRGTFQLESTAEEVAIPDFWLDRTEVTNRDFKAFIDAGGYRNRKYWTIPFEREGRELSWDAAMSLFIDATGRAGPSTWELGTYPEGQTEFPVAGVSWFEAAAYAVFAGKQLPTAYHWYRASGGFGVFSDITLVSNFSGKGPRQVGESGLGPYGTYDMAGNVKEWCWNASDPSRRYILGGAWSEASYMFRDQDAQSPFERRATFGFRCMLQEEPASEKLLATISTFERDITTLQPVAEPIYRAYRRLYDYDAGPLDARIEEKNNSNPAWLEERISIRAAYGDERVPIHLFLPKGSHPPYQAVVFFPHTGATRAASSQNLDMDMTDFFPRSGRVLVYPIYQGTYERRVPPYRGLNDFRDVMIQRAKDMRRTIEYLCTRSDIDSTKIAFYGISLGAQLGPLFLGIEPRFRAGVFFSGGFETWNIPPECDPVNFVTHVKVPVLMVNGREDFDLPYASAQVPMFNMLGTPPAHKRHVLFEGGHIPPDPQKAIKVMLDWLDTYLGPVN
jgi:eukaryotic-like serine/threonine-protein kinase